MISKPLVPSSIPFLSRSAEFVRELQIARLNWLRESQKSKTKGKKLYKSMSSGSTKSPKLTSEQKLALLIQEQLKGMSKC